MRIGQLAERSGVSAKALRHYEQVGVLPAPPRTESGYRDYGLDAIERVRFVRSGQRVGLSLRQLAGILEVRDTGRAPCTEALALVDARLRQVEESINKLQVLRDELAAVAAHGRKVDPSRCAAENVCVVINPSPPPSRGGAA